MKAINTAVDLIVAHFGTSRDPGVKVCLAFNIMSGMERMEKDCLSILFQSKPAGYPVKVVVPRINQTKAIVRHAADSKPMTILTASCWGC